MPLGTLGTVYANQMEPPAGVPGTGIGSPACSVAPSVVPARSATAATKLSFTGCGGPDAVEVAVGVAVAVVDAVDVEVAVALEVSLDVVVVLGEGVGSTVNTRLPSTAVGWLSTTVCRMLNVPEPVTCTVGQVGEWVGRA